MVASLRTLPTETQLQIFHLLVPSDPDEPRRTDLGNLRLTCKAILPSVNEIYFEHYYCLLWMRNGAFVESRSLQLLRNNPKYAALVKSTWVALAVAKSRWLRRRAAFGSIYAPGEEETIWKAYKQTSLFKESEFRYHMDYSYSDIAELDFTRSEAETVRRYHRQYIASPAYEQEYGPPPTDQIEEELRKRIALLPNVRHIRFERPPVIQTPFYYERLNFWMNNGFGEWAEQLAEPAHQDLPYHRCFPWNSSLIRAGLATLPPSCKSLQLDMQLFDPSSIIGLRLHNIFTHSAPVHTHLESLYLRIEPDLIVTIENRVVNHLNPDVTKFTNSLEVLARLELRCNLNAMTSKHARLETMNCMSIFFPLFSLAHLRHLGLARCTLHLQLFDKLAVQFPNLRVLCVEEVAIRSSEVDDLSKNLWYRLAKRISNEFGGNCLLQFEEGPFIEFHDSAPKYNHVLGEPDPLTRILKAPILEVLVEITKSIVVSTDIDEQYWNLVTHEAPDLPEYSTEWRWNYDYMIKEVETPGMKFLYFEKYFS